MLQSCLETPLTCYRIDFGPPARNRKNLENIGNGLPQKTGKNAENLEKWLENTFPGAFSSFSAIFSYFWGEAISSIFPIYFLFRA